MRAIELYTEEAREVVMKLKPSDIRNADALLLPSRGSTLCRDCCSC
jgi:hypothetical protein